MVSIDADTIVVPLASEQDAEETCASLEAHLDGETRIVVVHVIEKAGGGIDKASVEQRQERAERIFALARQHLEADGIDVDAEIYYGTDVADTIVEAAADIDAGLIVFSPREASRLSRLLSGDVALDLISRTERPVLVLPTTDDE